MSRQPSPRTSTGSTEQVHLSDDSGAADRVGPVDESRVDPASDPTGHRWMVPGWLDNLAAWIWRLGLVGLGTYVLLRLFWVIRLVTVPVLFALILTSLLWPLRRTMTDRRIPQGAASAIVMVVIAAALAGVGWIVTVGVGNELANDEIWSETRQEVEDWLIDGPLALTQAEVDDYEERLVDAVSSGAISLGRDRAQLVIEILGASLLTAVLLFFFLKDGPQMWAFLSRQARVDRRPAVARSGEAAFNALSGYARGVAITGVIDAIAVGIVLVILGVPLAVPLVILTFFGAFLPIVGATAVGGLSTLVALVAVGPQAAIILAVATLVIQQVEGDIVMPLAMGSQVQLHPAAVLIALAIGGSLAGLVGAFVAVPLAAVTVSAVRAFRQASSERGASATIPRASEDLAPSG